MKKYKLIRFIFILVLLCALIYLVISYYFDLKDFNKIIAYSLSAASIGVLIPLFIFGNVAKEAEFNKQKVKLWNNISYRVRKVGEKAFNDLPIGIMLYGFDSIEWANKYAKTVFENELEDYKFINISKELGEYIFSKAENFTVSIYGKIFEFQNDLKNHTLFFKDVTDAKNLEAKFLNRTLALGILNLDNLDMSLETLDAQKKTSHMSNIIGILYDWAEDNDVLIQGYSEEKYLMVMDYRVLNLIMKKEFPILDDVKAYCEKEGLRITVSIGIVCGDKNAHELMNEAEDLLELALSRGGNQAIVKTDNQLSYFGAKSEAFESRTPTYIRAKTEEIIEIISKHKKVYIMAHKYMDADAFGACLVASKIAQSCNKEFYVIIDEDYIDSTVKEMYKTSTESYIFKNSCYCTSAEALKGISEEDILLIVDCQYEKLLMNNKLLKKAKHVAIVDHHRRNIDAINKYDYVYSQPSASSTVELMVEMLEFLEEGSFELTPNEATSMLIGILVDTNNFMLHTTDRTFSVLSKLQKYGAEMGKAQKYLRLNVNEYTERIRALSQVEIIDDVYGVVCLDNKIYEREFIAKIADEVITIEGIKASFAIGKFSENEINISARSIDEENVQLIMEKLGGGGHYTIAACQFKDLSLEEVKDKLLGVLSANKSEGEQLMKVILVKDVKGKGKRTDVLEIPMGHANYLLRNGLAVEATPENLKQLELSLEREKEEQDLHLEEMKALKAKIEATSIKVQVKVGTNGHLFGTVSTKEVVEAFKSQNGIELDKRKILYDGVIDALGTYKLPIQLHKEVVATITLYVVEGK